MALIFSWLGLRALARVSEFIQLFIDKNRIVLFPIFIKAMLLKVVLKQSQSVFHQWNPTHFIAFSLEDKHCRVVQYNIPYLEVG